MIQTLLTPAELERRAEALRQARAARQPIEPLTDAFPDLSISDAYAIARCNVEARLRDGARVSGAKIGLTSPAVQAQLGVDQPDYGALLDEMEIADGASIDAGQYIAPRVELEVAFVLGEALSGPNVSAADVWRTTASLAASIELVDSRVKDWRIRLADTVADAASSAGYVLGPAITPGTDFNPADLAAALWRGDELVETGHSSAVLGDPCVSVAWLANALSVFGESLEAGQVILSGACTRMVSATAGDAFRGVIPGLGEVSIAFASDTTGEI